MNFLHHSRTSVATALGAAAIVCSLASPASAGSLDSVRTCAEVAAAEGVSLTELKHDDAPAVGDVYSDAVLSVTVTAVTTKPDGEVIGFKGTSTGGPVKYVIVKAATTTKVYNLAVVSSDGGTTIENIYSPGRFLYTAGQLVSGKRHHQEISYIAFCY